MAKVNRDHLFEFRLRLPDLKTQKKLATKLDALFTVLHRAFSGAL